MSENYNDRLSERLARRELRRQWRSRAGSSCGHSPAGRMFFAVFLIIAGVALFLDNIGLLRLRNIWEYSPLLTVGWGAALLSGAASTTRRSWGILLIVFGVFGTLLNLGVLRLQTRDDSWLLAVLLIAIGFLALMKTIESGAKTPAPPASRIAGFPPAGFPTPEFPTPEFPTPGPTPSADNVQSDKAVFGSIKRRIDTQNFEGCHIECVFGSVELDLRYSQIVPNGKPVVVDLKCVFSSAKLRIPDTWRVLVQAGGTFGNVEDKTIPPRAGNGPNTPLLLITGESVFSSVEVEN